MSETKTRPLQSSLKTGLEYYNTRVASNQYVSALPTRSPETHPVDAGRVFEQDEAKPPRPAGNGVDLYGAVWNFSKFSEVVLQVLFTGVPAQAPDKHFTVNKRQDGLQKGSHSCSHALRSLHFLHLWCIISPTAL